MKTILNLILMFGLAASAVQAQAQDEVPPPMPAAPTFSDAQLDQLLGPIALYPDPLIAVMLPAATQPSQIVVADRFIQSGGDPSQIDPSLDPNVQALAHYPDVLKWMDDNIAWTTQLGQAFQNQQDAVMASVQRLRTDAYNLGNLVSTPQQQVINDNGYIEIVPVSPDNLYVPDYQPQQVYYDAPSGPPFITFSVGFIIGPWLCCDFDWAHHNVIFWDRDHPRPSNWWHERPQQRVAYFDKHTAANVWRPENHPVYSGDRGYEENHNVNVNVNVQNRNANLQNRNAPPENNRNWNTQPAHENNPVQHTRTAPEVNHPSPAPPPPQHFDDRGNDAYVGVQSAHDTRDYSNRGQQSEQTMPRSSPPSGGGESYHSSGGGNTGGGEVHGGGGGGNQPPQQQGGGGGGRH